MSSARNSLCSESLHNIASSLVKSDDGASVIVLNAVRSPTGVDVVPDLQKSWSLMLVTGNERAVLIVPERGAMDWLLDAGRQVVGVDAVEVVASIRTPWRAARSEEA